VVDDLGDGGQPDVLAVELRGRSERVDLPEARRGRVEDAVLVLVVGRPARPTRRSIASAGTSGSEKEKVPISAAEAPVEVVTVATGEP
jgi:hypothetical protein